MPRLIFFSRHCEIFFTNADRLYFFTVEDAFLVGVAVKIYNVRRLGFFVRPQSKLWFDRHRHVFICLLTKTLAHLGRKLDSPILIEKNASRRRRGKINDRGLKKKHHRMTPIEHFQLDHHPNIIQGFNRKYNSRHWSV